jgi:hypothetical protein
MPQLTQSTGLVKPRHSRRIAHSDECRDPAALEAAKLREMKAQGRDATNIAKAPGIGRASVYRVLSRYFSPTT